MKTLLLGPNGQLGRDIILANHKAERPLELTPIDRAQLELSDINAAAEKLKDVDFECLINTTSYHNIDQVEANAQLAFTINSHVVEKLALLCRDKRARFVHISTDYVFGGQAKRSPLNEEDPRAPLNIYGASKGMGEDLARMAWDDVVIARVASLFGVAGPSGKSGNFVDNMIRFAKEKGSLRVVDDQVMSPSATADIAAALIDMITQRAPAGTWHVVNSGAASWYEFAKQIIDRSGTPATVSPVTSKEFPTAARRPPYSVLDNTKFTTAFAPMRPWQEALDDYLKAKGYRT